MKDAEPQPVQGCLSLQKNVQLVVESKSTEIRACSGSKQLTSMIVALTATLIVAPFFLWIWTAVATCVWIVLRTLCWLYPTSSIFSCGDEPKVAFRPEPVKKRVTIKEEENKYINEFPHESKEGDLEESSFPNTKIPTMNNRIYEDAVVSIDGLRIVGAHCNGGAAAEYKLHIVAEDGTSWRVWRTYNEIYHIHFIVERVLESDFTRNSFFTRIVPSIPPQNKGYFSMLFTNQRRLMNRRRAGLDEFMQRIFGNKSIEKYRRIVLRIPQVRAFLEMAPLPNQLPIQYRKKQLSTKPRRRPSRCQLVLPKSDPLSLFTTSESID